MSEKLLTMSQKELDRLSLIKQVEAKILSQVPAVVLLGISLRQVQNLQTQYKRYGAAGLISKHRGKQSNNRISNDNRQIIAGTIREKYVGFSPIIRNKR